MSLTKNSLTNVLFDLPYDGVPTIVDGITVIRTLPSKWQVDGTYCCELDIAVREVQKLRDKPVEKPKPVGYGERTYRIVYSSATDNFEYHDWLELAFAALDQAGAEISSKDLDTLGVTQAAETVQKLLNYKGQLA